MQPKSNRLMAYALPKTVAVRSVRHSVSALVGPDVPLNALGVALPPMKRTLAFDLLTLPTRALLGSDPKLLTDPKQAAQTPRTTGLLHLVRASNRAVLVAVACVAFAVGALLGAVVGRIVALAFEDKAGMASMWCICAAARFCTAPFVAIERLIDAALWANTAAVARAANALFPVAANKP